MLPTSACLATCGLARPAVRTSNDVQRCASQALVLAKADEVHSAVNIHAVVELAFRGGAPAVERRARPELARQITPSEWTNSASGGCVEV
jgi:hypothetical protein